MRAEQATIGTKYLSPTNVPVIVKGILADHVKVEVTCSGNVVKVPKDYKLSHYLTSKVPEDLKYLLNLNIRPSDRGTPEAKERMAKARQERRLPTGPSIGETAVACIKKGMDFVTTLAEVKKVRPDCQMKMASYNWYKAKIKKGLLLLLAIPLLHGCVAVHSLSKDRTTNLTTINPIVYQEVPPEDTAKDQWEEYEYSD